MSYLFNNVTKPANADAFSRTRTSDVYTIDEHTHIYQEEPIEMTSKLNGSGTYSFIPNQAAIKLSVGTTSGDYAIYQSKLYHHYSPGKSQLVLHSFTFGTASTNVTRRVGYYDDRDGIYFQQTGDGTLSFVLRSYTTGTVSETTFTQSYWNHDRLDGTGASGITFDPTKIQLFFTDFQWLGAGRVRFGFVLDGEPILAHSFYNANNNSTVYWSNPSLPTRTEILNTGNTTGTASMFNLCSSVMSEGGYSEVGIIQSVSSDKRTLSSTASSIPSVALMLKNQVNGAPNRLTVKLTSVDVLALDNPLKFEIWKLSGSQSVTGGTWVSALNASGVIYNITGTTYSTTGGLLVNTGLIPASSTTGGQVTKSPGAQDVSNFSQNKKVYITQNYDSTGSDIFAVVVKALDVTGGSCNFHVSVQWSEF